MELIVRITNEEYESIVNKSTKDQLKKRIKDMYLDSDGSPITEDDLNKVSIEWVQEDLRPLIIKLITVGANKMTEQVMTDIMTRACAEMPTISAEINKEIESEIAKGEKELMDLIRERHGVKVE